MNWEMVIGIEVHAQLITKTKLFSESLNAFCNVPNSNIAAVDLGLPGVLPVLNKAAVEQAIRFGLATGSKIQLRSCFDRKNYFYADLPKGYQTSQFHHPIIGNGSIEIQVTDHPPKTIRITRAHLEEDAGKSTH